MEKNYTLHILSILFKKHLFKGTLLVALLVFMGLQNAKAQRFSTEKTENSTLSNTWNLSKIDFDIYPNPSRGSEINIKVKGLEEDEAELILYNTIGGVVWKKKVEVTANGEVKATLNPSEQQFTRGLYLLSIAEKGQRTMKKVIIN